MSKYKYARKLEKLKDEAAPLTLYFQVLESDNPHKLSFELPQYHQEVLEG